MRSFGALLTRIILRRLSDFQAHSNLAEHGGLDGRPDLAEPKRMQMYRHQSQNHRSCIHTTVS